MRDEVLLLLAPQDEPARREGDVEGDDDGERLEKPLGVVVALVDGLSPLAGDEAVERLAPALQLQDPLRLLTRLVDRQEEEAVAGLVVERLGVGRGEEDGRGAVDPAVVGHLPPGLRVGPGDRAGERAAREEVAEGVGRLRRAVFLVDGQELVREGLLFLVEEDLARDAGVLDEVLRRAEVAEAVLQGRLARARAGAEEDGEGLLELSGDEGEVADEHRRLLADEADGEEVRLEGRPTMSPVRKAIASVLSRSLIVDVSAAARRPPCAGRGALSRVRR